MQPTIVEPKPGLKMGRVLVPMRVENMENRTQVARGKADADGVRGIEVEALVDTGATFVCLPKTLAEQLGLNFMRTRETRTPAGRMQFEIYTGAWIEVQERDCTAEVLALPKSNQAILGQIVLETLDWWVDLANRKLVGNPEHDGQWMVDV